MFALELSHERNERIDAFFRKCVVDGGAHPAHGPVTFEAIETGGG
jgi:hypothetical protein